MRCEHRRRRISDCLKKFSSKLVRSSEGKLQWAFGLFGCLFLMLIAMYEFQLAAYRSASTYMEDALAASGLAALLIDLERYGKDHSIVIDDPYYSYEIYRDTIKINLGLDDEYVSGNETLFYGPISIEEFHIYNVVEQEVTIICVNESGITSIEKGTVGRVTAPNGQIVYKTGVYGELAFSTKGFMGVIVDGRKGKLVEINRNESEEINEE